MVEEIQEAEYHLLSVAQQQDYGEEIIALRVVKALTRASDPAETSVSILGQQWINKGWQKIQSFRVVVQAEAYYYP